MKKKKIAKSLLSVVLAILILFSVFSVSACEMAKAEEFDYEIAPCFTTIMTEVYGITIKGLQATVSGTLVSCYKTSLQITLELQKYTNGGWYTDQTWAATTYDISLITEGKKVINIFAEYRLKVTFKADKETSVRYRYPS